jgi:hypothetical protein
LRQNLLALVLQLVLELMLEQLSRLEELATPTPPLLG